MGGFTLEDNFRFRPDPNRPTIVAAAVKYMGCVISLPRPARHLDILYIYDIRVEDKDWGYLTSDGRFVDRHEATPISIQSGQKTIRPVWPPALHSEDLW